MPKAKTKTTKSVKTKKLKNIKSASKLLAPLFNAKGRAQGTISLPKETFGTPINERLLAQAVRVYFANRSAHFATTKTRAEVRGGGRKPHRQKGTGRARAGSIRSPLWVGGGVALGPKPRKVKLSLPRKMRRKALISALSAKQKSGDIKVILGIEKIPAKTKVVSTLLEKLKVRGNTLLVISPNIDQTNVKLAARNIPDIAVTMPLNLNAYEVIKSHNILFSKEAIAALAQVFWRAKIQ